MLSGRRVQIPIYVCTSRSTFQQLLVEGLVELLEALGVIFVVDTCVVVTRILPPLQGVLMTNSGKFAHYALPNVGYRPVFGTLEECVDSALRGVVRRNADLWV
jgi:predicted aconitase